MNFDHIIGEEVFVGPEKKKRLFSIHIPRGHSQTTLKSRWPFLTNYLTPLRRHFLPYKKLTKNKTFLDYLPTHPPPLVNVVCERPLAIIFYWSSQPIQLRDKK